MAKIAYIKEGVTKGRVLLGIDTDVTAQAYSITLATYMAIGAPTRYTELTERDFDSVCREDERYRAMKKAVSLLAASDKSAYTVRTKLYLAGFSRESIDEAVSECISRGYIDESRQLSRLISKEANEGLRGKYYIKRKLASKGYKLSDIDRVMSELVDEGEIDFRANFERLADKKGASGEEERRALLYKFGYRT